MGGGHYNTHTRSFRAAAQGYTSVTADSLETVFKQKDIHPDMKPSTVLGKPRESADSADHPNTVPVQLYLDVTGSMGHIPAHLISSGLPTLISSLIEGGIPDVALMFGAIGDHKCDNAPLQLGQFESSDEKLDHWLTNTYIEGNGGGNGGESYALAWYQAARHTRTDAWDKRQKKGFVFTIGNEPCHEVYPVVSLKRIYSGDLPETEGTNASSLFEEACRTNHVYHIHVTDGRRDLTAERFLKGFPEENFIVVNNYHNIPATIEALILANATDEVVKTTAQVKTEEKQTTDSSDTVEPIL